MKRHLAAVFFFWTLATAPFGSAGQGCSDAGFCSAGNLASHADDSEDAFMHTVVAGVVYGSGQGSVQTFTPYLEYKYAGIGRWLLQVKINGVYATGDLGSVSGLGDVYLAATYAVSKATPRGFSISGGVKLPLDDASNTGDAGLQLPMDYQSSLGTYDFIAGVRYVFQKDYELSAGVQVPFSNQNDNRFYPVLYNQDLSGDFVATAGFERKPDVLLRGAKNFSFRNRKWMLKPGILCIYHLGDDTYTNPLGTTKNIDGSSGLTVNIHAALSWRIRPNSILEFFGATPVVVRDVRPDGLTRSVVAGLSYSMGINSKQKSK